MPYTEQEIKETIEKGLPGSVVFAEDFKGTGDHFNIVVVSPSFEGISAVERHRMVHRAMNEIIEGDIHALHIKTLTPEAAEKAGFK
jgi:stress-induced morphogen